MMPDWLPYTYPFELFGVLTLSGISLLYAFVMHLRVRTLVRRSRERHEELESRLRGVAERIERLQPPAAEEHPPVQSPGRSLQLNQRGQALRMRHRGEKLETISAALGIPRNEIDLLFKVHQLSLEAVENKAAG